MYVTAFYTTNGDPALGLTPKVSIWNVSTHILLVDDVNMSEVGGGWYEYDYAAYDSSIDYAIRCDGGATLGGFERYTYAGNESFSGDIADAVWDEPLAGHTTAGTTGKVLGLIKKGIDAIIAAVT